MVTSFEVYTNLINIELFQDLEVINPLSILARGILNSYLF